MAKHGLWPTPTIKRNYNRAGLSSKSGDGLATAVKMWPTPSATDHKGSVTGDTLERRRGMTRGVRLAEQVMRTFPTPVTTRPHDSENTAGKFMPGQKQHDLTAAVASGGGQLSPQWVEWLMGFPLGWTALEPSATPSSRKSSK
jgi:hypothetical protein